MPDSWYSEFEAALYSNKMGNTESDGKVESILGGPELVEVGNPRQALQDYQNYEVETLEKLGKTRSPRGSDF